MQMTKTLVGRATASIAGLGAAALVLAGCAAPDARTGEGGPSIVATTTQVGDFARQLLGEQGELTQLVKPDQSAHDFDPSAAQLLAIGEADALVVNGAGLESWLGDVIDASGFDGRLIDASTGIELEATGDDDHDGGTENGGQGGDADDHATVLPEKPEPSTAPAPGDDDHDHGAGNPHIWTSPENAEQMVQNIAAGLEEVEGVDAGAIRSAADAYLARLDDLDEWIDAGIGQVPEPDRLLVTNHDAFTYFVDEYDITFVGSVIPSFDDNAEPSAAEIDALVERIRQTGAKAVFSEASLSPEAAETIAREAGVAVFSGPDALYGDSLGAAGSPGETYLGSQIHNVRLILKSWGVEAPPLPASLEG
ncbi:metal ABC transporter substrate-binding protein [Agromyces archimandritae]|uniref:Zinc ABC transporter substrate-binding protein n=1 Tax=Agromyces archimandritae TaxID=2781962 RepID=A0A975FK39_9MICO|nr:metal ABC transporter substrate-binding protein [Agromyces archimandritae]QTX03326.1 zinc ABC transporter substrate-binding protein [Agromyces archimandritae]